MNALCCVLWINQTNQAPLVPDLTISNLAEAGFGENLFSDHRTICLIKLMASTMLSAAINRQYSSVVSLLRHCLPFFDETCGMAMGFVFFI